MVGDDLTLELHHRVSDHSDDRPSPGDPQSGISPEPRGVSTLSRLRWTTGAFAVGDALSLIGSLLVASFLAGGKPGLTSDLVPTLIVGPVVWVTTFHAFGLYGWTELSRPSVLGGLRRLAGATSVGVLVIAMISVRWDSPLPTSSLGGTVMTALTFELLIRGAIRWRIRRDKQSGRLAMRTLFVGANDEARELCRRSADSTGWFLPVGSVALSRNRDILEDLPVAGHLDALDAAIRRSDAECVFVATSAVSADDVLNISQACRRADIELCISANVSDIHTSRVSIGSTDGITTLSVRPSRATLAQAAVKRGLDLALGSAMLLVSIPVLASIALAIRLESRGPVLFRQARVTKGGAVFTIYKFRTMVEDVERALDGVVIDLTQPFFKMEDDPRLTRVGRFLRSYSLDELPQLWNVIRGDMSLVGPRPLPAEQVAANEAFLRPRHEVPAGLTGLWQTSGRSELDSEDALRIDRFYIENWSLSLDLHILLKTLMTVATRRGAY